VLPPDVDRAVTGYLGLADRLLPGRVHGLYVVGSTALGAYLPGRSDIDLVVVLDGPDPDLRAVRALHLRRALATAALAVRRGHSPISGTCNTVFVRRADVTLPVGRIVPVATANAEKVSAGTAATISPVDGKVLAESGIAVRGPRPDALGLDPQPDRLEAYNRENLESYWRPWAGRYRGIGRVALRLYAGRATAWGVLGPPRLHCTIATGQVVSKAAAGEYALDTFDSRWHPLIRHALTWWRRERPAASPLPPAHVAAFVEHVADSAPALPRRPC
jgi:hypothetical protein